MRTRAQIANPNPEEKSRRPRPARQGSVLRPWPRKAPTRTRTTTTTTITALIRNWRDHGTRPLLIEKAATSQYSQNNAHPTAKTNSTALIASHPPTSKRLGGRRVARHAANPTSAPSGGRLCCLALVETGPSRRAHAQPLHSWVLQRGGRTTRRRAGG